MDWRIAAMKPGDGPFAALAEAMPQWDPKLPAGERAGLIASAKKLLSQGQTGSAPLWPRSCFQPIRGSCW
jgi:hypothetical protein